MEDEFESQEGMFVDECGYINPKLINVPEEGIAQYQNARVVVVDGDVSRQLKTKAQLTFSITYF